MSDPLIGSKLGDYQILELLGQGGMARVYRGHDAHLDRYAAVKVTDEDFVADEVMDEYEARFTREARAIAHLKHPNIVGVYQFGKEVDRYFMAMHFIEGRDLRYVLAEHAEQGILLPQEQAISIMRDVASALDYAHQHDVIHRDIKPSNIMITPDGTAVLTDFGLVLNVPEGTIGNTFGSALYIAPEQALSSAQAVPQSDFYSLGVILFQMVTGQVPFDDPSTMSVALKHVQEPPPLPSLINPDVSPAVEDVIMTMLRKTPADRYPDGAAMIAALTAAVSARTPASPTEPTASSTEPTPVVTASLVEDETTAEMLAVGRRVEKPPDAVSIPSKKRKDDSHTLVYSLLAKTAAARQRGGRGRRIALLLILLVVLGIGGGLVAVQTGLLDPALLGVGMVAAPTAAEPTEVPATTEPTSAPTDESATVEPAMAPTDEPATPELTAEPTTTPTDEPATAVPTTEPTEAPAAVEPTASLPAAEAADPHLLLLYDEENIQFINLTDTYINVLPLEFRRTTEDGHILFLQAADFTGGTDEPDALSPGNCFHAWPSSVSTNARAVPIDEDYCAARVGWRMLSSDRLFWIADEADATFTVVAILARGEEVLTTCTIAAGECPVTLSYED